LSKNLVSVVIPSFNRFKYLLKAIESVQNQSFKDFNIIVIDDASYEDSYKNATFEENVKVIRLNENSVSSKGYFSDSIRNIGILNSESKYVAFLDDDDYWLPNKLESQINKLESSDFKISCSEAYTGSGVYNPKEDYKLYLNNHCYKEISHIYKKSRIKNNFKNKLQFQFQFPEVWDINFLKVHNCIITSSVIVERELLNRIGNFRDIKTKKLYADYDCWLGLLTHSDCYFFNEPLLYYDLNEGMNINTI